MIPIVCVLLPALPALTLFAITLCSLALCGALVACFTGGLFAVLGTYPVLYTQALVSGQGLAGCAVSVVSFITIAAGKQDAFFCSEDEEDDDEECGNDLDYSALAFFSTCCVVVIIALGCYLVLENLPSTRCVVQDRQTD